MTLTVPNLPAKPAEVKLATSVGHTRTLPFDYADGTLKCAVPMGELPTGIARDWGREWKVRVGYVVVQ